MFRNALLVCGVLTFSLANAEEGGVVEWTETIAPKMESVGYVASVMPTAEEQTKKTLAQVLSEIQAGIKARQADVSYAVKHDMPLEIPLLDIFGADQSIDETGESVSDPLVNDVIAESNRGLPNSNDAVTPYIRRVPLGGERNKLYVSRNGDGSLLGSHAAQPTVRSGEGSSISTTIPSSPLTSSKTVVGVGGVGSNSGLRNVGGLTQVNPRTVADFDPFKTMIQWDWDGISVGEGMRRLASFVGYNLVVRDESARVVYTMPLPGSHQVVSGIDTKTALELLGGPAFTLVVDHGNRTIHHVVKAHYIDEDLSKLPPCPANLEFAMQSGNAWIIEGGMKCVYRGRLSQLKSGL